METTSGYPIMELFSFPSLWTENSAPHTTSLWQLWRSLKMVSATHSPVWKKSKYTFPAGLQFIRRERHNLKACSYWARNERSASPLHHHLPSQTSPHKQVRDDFKIWPLTLLSSREWGRPVPAWFDVSQYRNGLLCPCCFSAREQRSIHGHAVGRIRKP